MNGRTENSIKLENKIKEMLNETPDYVRAWEMSLEANGNQPTARRDYLYKVISFLNYINSDIKNVKPADITSDIITEYFVKIKYRTLKDGTVKETSDSYKQSVWCCLDNFCEFLYRRNYIESNYVKEVKKPKNKDLQRINKNRILLTEDDFNKIIAAVEDDHTNIWFERNLAIVLILMMYGIRRTALTEINISDIDFENKKLFVIDKGEKYHEYYISDLMENVLKDWIAARSEYIKKRNLKDCNALFISTHGTRIEASVTTYVLDKYCVPVLEKHISPHKLRSGFCSIMYKKTGDIEMVRRMVGHSNVATTQRYIVTANEERKESIEIMSNLISA